MTGSQLLPLLFRIRACAVVLAAALPATAAAAGRTGEEIYRKQCVSCHGKAGEGTHDNHPHVLAGDRSVKQLARLIARSMPKDDPGTVTGEDADKVAAYVYESFYSRAARERNRPARVELARLTVRQYRNAVADLVGSFRGPAPRWDDRRGLRGEYFNARGFRTDRRLLDRADPEVRFDFGTKGPAGAKFDDYEFSVRWTGSVLAPESGEYEFVVRTEHGTRLWVNDPRRPLIDAWVKSGKDTEFRGSVTLLGGRAYPLRLEFTKANQGVDDQKQARSKPPAPASVTLLWKPPQRVLEVVPARNLSPGTFPQQFVSTTPFPPDDRSVGYERGTSVSRAWDQAATDAAVEAAGYAAAHLGELAGVGDDAPDRPQRLRDFCHRFAERAFRRPLTDEQKKLYVDRRFEKSPDPVTAVKRAVLLVLKSPRFLYREAGGDAPDAYDVASRISFALWDSLPDTELLAAAKANRLATRDQVARQAERMLADLRAHAKLREFLLQWLKVEHPPDMAKDRARYPDFSPEVANDLRTSLELFLEDVVWGGSSDFRQLFLSEELYLNGRLAKLYGGGLAPETKFSKVKPEPGKRAGVLTHPYLMATFAYTQDSSPIHRGVFLARSVLGVSLRPPPDAFTPLPADLHPGLNTRERVTLQTRPQSCQTCHGVINPLGFTLEHFDAVGRYRDRDNGKPVDATGSYLGRGGDLVKFGGERDLANFLAGSVEVQAAFAEQLFQNLVQQPVRAYGPQALADLRQSFALNGFSIRKLVIEEVAASALTGRGTQQVKQSAAAAERRKEPGG